MSVVLISRHIHIILEQTYRDIGGKTRCHLANPAVKRSVINVDIQGAA